MTMNPNVGGVKVRVRMLVAPATRVPVVQRQGSGTVCPLDVITLQETLFRRRYIMIRMLYIPLALCLASGATVATYANENHTTGDTGKTVTLTGCLQSTSEDGVYILKTEAKQVEVRGKSELKDHVGHQVKLSGNWADGRSASSGKEKTSSAGKEKTGSQEQGRHLAVTNIEHIAASCPKK